MDISFSKVENEHQLIAIGLDEFASSFGHDISRVFPIWVAYLNGTIISYCHMHRQMVAYPAVSPKLTPRQSYNLAWTWFSKIKSEYGDPLIVMDKGSFSPELLSKIGLDSFNKDVYVIRE